tara:strand:- start:3368 stop:4441 length:1074 start_codon:yes stop_codon:yes gene_type:complete
MTGQAFLKTVTIDGRKIGPGHPPYIIAELSANHNGDLGRAMAIMEAAKEAGAHAVKLQTYRPDTITLDCDTEEFRIRGGLWDGRTLYELYTDAHMPWDWHTPLFDKARDLGITIFSSPFDETAVDLLEDLGTPAYKIASFEAIDLPLIRRVAQTGKPLIISTGLASETEIAEAIAAAAEGGCEELVLLHCISGYPAPAADYNLNAILRLHQAFEVPVGLSDHTIDNVTAIAAVALGACVIEKHVTLDRDGGGPDDSFSLEPDALKALCRDSFTAWQALGHGRFERAESEKGNIKFRRSLYVVRDVKAGERVTPENVRSIRPGFGLAPKELDRVMGQRFVRDVSRGTPLRHDVLTHEG